MYFKCKNEISSTAYFDLKNVQVTNCTFKSNIAYTGGFLSKCEGYYFN